MAEKHISVIDLNNPTSILKNIESPLKHMIRAVSCFKDADGFTIGSIEARCAFHWVDDTNKRWVARFILPRLVSFHFQAAYLTLLSKNMSFRCHRDPILAGKVTCWPINAISTHPRYGTMSTAGSDGTFHFWDKESKSRLRGYPSVGCAISATAFNFDGTLFAYAKSYDWHKGYSVNTPDYQIKVMLHHVIEEEVQPKHHRKRWRSGRWLGTEYEGRRTVLEDMILLQLRETLFARRYEENGLALGMAGIQNHFRDRPGRRGIGRLCHEKTIRIQREACIDRHDTLANEADSKIRSYLPSD